MKANLSTMTKYVNAIIGSKQFPCTRDFNFYKERLEDFGREKCEQYAFIYHNKDKDEDGSAKHLHIHCVFILKSSKTRLNTTLNTLATICEINNLAIQVDKLSSINGSLQYLIHKNEDGKFHYDRENICTNIPTAEMETYLNTQQDSMSATYLIDVVQKCKGNKLEILKTIGLGYYHLYRNTINDIVNELMYN